MSASGSEACLQAGVQETYIGVAAPILVVRDSVVQGIPDTPLEAGDQAGAVQCTASFSSSRPEH